MANPIPTTTSIVEEKSVKKTSEDKAEKKVDNLCQQSKKYQRKICEYGSLTALCGVLVVNFHKNWATDQPSKFFLSLKELVKKEGAVIQSVDKKLGIMSVCYNLNPEYLDLKKKQLKKHSAVNFITYDLLISPMRIPN